MRIIDLTNNLFESFDDNRFNIERWKNYIDSNILNLKELCLKDMEESLEKGFSFNDDYLPILSSVINNKDKLNKLKESFYNVTNNLDERIIKRFNRSIDCDIILYLGLLNGAGWVTELNNKTVILLGIEKIIELNWCDIDSMNGLIIHELGHAYHMEFGILRKDFKNTSDELLYELYEEGIAMVFEQEVIGDPNYFHQNDNEWKMWCSNNLDLLKTSFYNDLSTMNHDNQRYFGDWVYFNGHNDTGYFLGAKFIRYLLNSDSFDSIITYDIDKIRDEYILFMNKNN